MRRDQWRGPRPAWWKGNYRVGPALGYAYYRANGFRHDRDRYWRGNDWRQGRDWDRNRWRNGGWAHPGNVRRVDEPCWINRADVRERDPRTHEKARDDRSPTNRHDNRH